MLQSKSEAEDVMRQEMRQSSSQSLSFLFLFPGLFPTRTRRVVDVVLCLSSLSFIQRVRGNFQVDDCLFSHPLFPVPSLVLVTASVTAVIWGVEERRGRFWMEPVVDSQMSGFLGVIIITANLSDIRHKALVRRREKCMSRVKFHETRDDIHSGAL